MNSLREPEQSSEYVHTTREEQNQTKLATEKKAITANEHQLRRLPQFSFHIEQQVTQHFYQSRHITAIGDSLTQGVGDETAQGGYVGALQAMLEETKTQTTFDNFGVRGNRSDQLLKRLEQDDIIASIQQADIVFITIGANDIMRVLKENITNLQMDDFEKARMDYEKRLDKIISNIHAINTDANIYLLGFYNPFGEYFKDIKELKLIAENWNKTGEQLVNKHENSSFIPMMDLFSNPEENLFAEDNFHPNRLGYQRIAERIFEVMKNKQKRG
ncbi:MULTISPECIES: SGNH/GDSL hydrolase family protein [Clostridia]|uniref:SGNH/GDSL hydrolase family protein n=1 Tax=Clostridia TaxID=186801 RepID=UPI0013148052|nr:MULTISPECIES: SGNH/GDSL hydrolase family protein [Clostridia]